VKSVLSVQLPRYISVPHRYCPVRKKNIMIWTVALSTFVLNRVCELVKEWITGVQIFRNHDLKAIAEVVLKFTGREVGVDRLYNHMRHRREMWVHVCMLKMLEGVRWVEKTSATMIDNDAYYAYIKVSILHLLLHFIH
jgi:hypothetical protein